MSWTDNRSLRAGAGMMLAGLAAPALAGGTPAGTKIDNTATASYDLPNGGSGSVQSNVVSLTVAERLDVAAADANGGDVGTTPAASSQVTRFTVTNSGNGSEAIELSVNAAVGGDNFDPGSTSIVIDANGNGTYDAGVDTTYVAGSNDPVLTPDQSITVFILSAIPAGASDGQRGSVQLIATAATGTGPAGTIFAGLGDAGTDAVVGTTTANASATGTYLVSAASVAFAKSASIADPFGGTQPLPGAIITYTLTGTISGSGSIANLRIADPLPDDTDYVPGSLKLEGASLTDAADADSGEVVSSAVAVRLGTVPAGAQRSVTFQVKIK